MRDYTKLAVTDDELDLLREALAAYLAVKQTALAALPSMGAASFGIPGISALITRIDDGVVCERCEGIVPTIDDGATCAICKLV